MRHAITAALFASLLAPVSARAERPHRTVVIGTTNCYGERQHPMHFAVTAHPRDTYVRPDRLAASRPGPVVPHVSAH